MAWMQCAGAVQCQQAKSLFHNVVTDLLVCQSLDVNAEVGPFSWPAAVQSFRWHGCNVPKSSSDNRLKAYSTTW
jgi:hypothetical protein